MTTEMKAGASVVSASVNDRKISTSSTMMNSAEKSSTWLPVLPDCLLLVDLDGDVAGQVRLQPGRQPGAGDLRPHAR